MSTSLNSQQEEAVAHLQGPLLVLAGAGSGKTRIITQRVVHLLNVGVPAGEILAVTFTNKAAGEMRHRIERLCHRHILTCTFHSLCAKILRESIHELGYTTHFSIYDEDDSLQLVKACLKHLELADDASIVKAMKHSISQAKNDLKSPQDVESCSRGYDTQAFKSVYTMYQQKLKEYGALDFDDLLFLTVSLLKNFPKVKEIYQNRWRFVLVDEYQDTNKAQYELTKLLVEKHQNLFVVGDPDQSIYSWRGADIQNILSFEKDFPNARVIKLEQNYRSTGHILSAANSLIEQNCSRYEKNLWSALGDGEKVEIYIHENELEESRYVVEKIVEYQKRGIPFFEMAIFYRTNAQSRSFEDLLLRKKIPYVIVGGISFYQRKEIKDLLSLLRMTLSDTDYLSFARTINLPKRGLGASTLQKIKEYAECHNLPILAASRELLQGNVEGLKLSAKQSSGLQDYVRVIEAIRRKKEQGSFLKDILKEAVEASRYLEHLKEDPETYDDRKANVDELIAKAAEWEVESSSSSLELFLEELSLKSSADDLNNTTESLKLMTLHNGKGLEFEAVFIVGLEEDLLPHVNSKESPEQIEEERRLFYVGMTRAKRHLCLTGSKYRMIWGMPKVMSPTRFLQEIDRDHVRWHERKQTFALEEERSSEFLPGDGVLHKDFGRGTVRKVYNTSLGTTYDVFFTDLRETKSLVAKFARLQSL